MLREDPSEKTLDHFPEELGIRANPFASGCQPCQGVEIIAAECSSIVTQNPALVGARPVLPSAAVKFFYFYRVPLPSARADAIQIIHTCTAIARAGAEVILHVEQVAGVDLGGLYDYYGIPPSEQAPAGSLGVRAAGAHWSWPFLHVKAGRAFREARGSEGCLFVREVRRYVPGLVAKARRAGLAVIFEAHNVSASLAREKEEGAGGTPDARARTQARESLERSVLASADGLVCTQQATLERLRPFLRPGAPAIVLGNGARLVPEAPAETRDLDVLYCGSLKPWKGVDVLVAAMQTLHPWTLTIVGPGTDADVARLRQVALGLGLPGRVRILPPVRPAEVWGLYARARVGVVPLPSGGSIEARDFTSPLKLFEMLASGLPIVASNLPSLAEYLQDEREALLVAPDDPRALSTAIRRLLTDEPLRRRLSEAARERAASFTWEARGRRIVEFASGLLRGRGRA